MTTIVVAAGLVTDPGGRLLLVRKRGTSTFIQPGGKPERGETPAAALVRELAEETGIAVDVSRLQSLGLYEDAAANEPGRRVRGHCFGVRLTAAEAEAAVPYREIAEAVWVTPPQARSLALAPLTANALLPLVEG